jgi:hypothetical protein
MQLATPNQVRRVCVVCNDEGNNDKAGDQTKGGSREVYGAHVCACGLQPVSRHVRGDLWRDTCAFACAFRVYVYVYCILIASV